MDVRRTMGVNPLDRVTPGSENRTAFLARRGVLGGGIEDSTSSCFTMPTLLRRVRLMAMGTLRSAIALNSLFEVYQGLGSTEKVLQKEN